MEVLYQSPLDDAFIQNPYPVYADARRRGPVLWWDDYDMLAAFDYATVNALLKDKRLGREVPAAQRKTPQPHMAAFDAVDAHSMLELEPPRHTRLRGLVLRAFTSRRIAALQPDIAAICADLLAKLPNTGDFDLIPAFCADLPVRVIARLLGVPESLSPDLLRWSNAMVAMYQAGRTRDVEIAAAQAAQEFTDFLRSYIEKRRSDPRDDLISHLIAAEADGDRLSPDEMISTIILLLNAGHEATVHSLGNAVKCLIEHRTPVSALAVDTAPQTVEELLRFDPPLHMFTRYAYEDIALGAITLKNGDEIALILGAAGRDPAKWDNPDSFVPDRRTLAHAAFGGGIHFCVGAPLARLEMQMALPALFNHLPAMTLAQAPKFSNSYHFHKLDQLWITR